MLDVPFLRLDNKQTQILDSTYAAQRPVCRPHGGPHTRQQACVHSGADKALGLTAPPAADDKAILPMLHTLLAYFQTEYIPMAQAAGKSQAF